MSAACVLMCLMCMIRNDIFTGVGDTDRAALYYTYLISLCKQS